MKEGSVFALNHLQECFQLGVLIESISAAEGGWARLVADLSKFGCWFHFELHFSTRLIPDHKVDGLWLCFTVSHVDTASI